MSFETTQPISTTSFNSAFSYGRVPQHAKEVLQTINKIDRLKELRTLLDTDKEDFEKIELEFTEFLQRDPATVDISDFLTRFKMYITRFDPLFKDFASPVRYKDLAQKIQQYVDEFMLVRPASCVQESRFGKASGACLVDFNDTHLVLKKTTIEEFMCNRIFELFLSKLLEVNKVARLGTVPDSVLLTKKNQILFRTDGTWDKANEECSFLPWFQARREACSPQGDLMISATVQGVTVADFIASGQYKLLSASKRKEFFRSLGSLGMVDLILGNEDRMYKLDDLDDPQEDECVSNLGNIMVQISDDESLKFFLIDNVLSLRQDWGVIFKHSPQDLAHLMGKQLHGAFNVLEFPSRDDDSIKSFEKDCIEYTKAIEMGIHEMKETLKDFIPKLSEDIEWIALAHEADKVNRNFRYVFGNLPAFLKSNLTSLTRD